MFGDAASLFGEASGAGSSGDQRGAKRPAEEEPAEKRCKLRAFDNAVIQMTNPNGPSIAEDAPAPKLWAAAATGSKWCAYHHELAAGPATGGNYRVGVGLSRVAEALLAAIERLDAPTTAMLVKESALTAAKADADKIRPSLAVLNAGRGSESAGQGAIGFKSLCAAPGALKKAPTEEEIRKAAKVLHDWWSQERSPLRAFVSIMSQGRRTATTASLERPRWT